jgi:hypothetical protein
VVVPYSNVHLLTDPPLGLTLALSVADFSPTLDVPLVSTDGAAIFAVVKPTSGLAIGRRSRPARGRRPRCWV